MSDPDLAGARQLFHHRDAALDEPYGEGVEVTLYALPDGRLYQEEYRYHIDFDGSNDDRVVSREDAIQTLAAHGASALAAELFPDAPEARWFRRFGTCRWYDLGVERVAAEAEVVWRGPGFLAAADRDGPWVLDRPGSDGQPWRSLERPAAALAALTERGCPVDVLARHFPEAPAVRLLRRAGAATWPEASARALPALAAQAAVVHEAAPPGGAGRERLVRVEPGVHLLERAGPPPAYEALDDRGAAAALLRLGADAAAWARLLPAPGAAAEAVRALQRAAGVSFPG